MYDIVCIGTATRDVFLQSPFFRGVKDSHFTPQAGFPTGEAECFALGGKIEINEPVFTTGGGATNAAVTFARQGFSVAVVAAVGKDESGKAVAADLRKEGVKPFVSRVKDLKTAYSTLLLSPEGERTVLIYRGAADEIGRVQIGKLGAKWAYISPGAIDAKRMRALVGRLVDGGVKVAMNPSGHYIKNEAAALKKMLGQLSVVIFNREEAASFTGVSYEDVGGIFKKMNESAQGIAVLTDGPRGVLVSDGKNLYKAGIFKEKQLVDRTGAGDAFGSGFVAALINKARKQESKKTEFSEEDIKYAIRLASANATSVVEYIGAKVGILTKERFLQEERWKDLPIETAQLD